MGPQHYEIRVAGVVPQSALIEMEGMRVVACSAQTVIRGPVPDQAALLGIFHRLQGLGLDLLEVRRMTLDDRAEPSLRYDSKVSSLLVVGAWWLFEWEQSAGASLTEARTAALNLFVITEMFYLFACRSLTHSAWHIGLFSNKWLIVGVSVQIIGQLAITYLPAMNRLFQTAPIGTEVWLRIVAIAALASLVVAIDKRFRRQLM